MKRLRGKLHSRRGASILLALLFFLVCMLVAASVLMAAVSNAGKLRSNYEEQQKYLALSSAIRLVAGQIEDAEYTGKYTVYEWSVPQATEEEPDLPPIDYFYVEQSKGEFTCGELTGTADTVLDFTKELDGVFAKQFTGGGYKPLTGVDVANLPAEKKLTVTVGGDEDSPIKEKFKDVKVTVKMDDRCAIRLTATLNDGKNEYTMAARLSLDGSFPTLNYSPGSRTAGSSAGTGVAGVSKEMSPLKWKLDWIGRGGAMGG